MRYSPPLRCWCPGTGRARRSNSCLPRRLQHEHVPGSLRACYKPQPCVRYDHEIELELLNEVEPELEGTTESQDAPALFLAVEAMSTHQGSAEQDPETRNTAVFSERLHELKKMVEARIPPHL